PHCRRSTVWCHPVGGMVGRPGPGISPAPGALFLWHLRFLRWPPALIPREPGGGLGLTRADLGQHRGKERPYRSGRHWGSTPRQRQEAHRETSGLAGFSLRLQLNGVAEAVRVQRQLHDLRRRIDLLEEDREKVIHQLALRYSDRAVTRERGRALRGFSATWPP